MHNYDNIIRSLSSRVIKRSYRKYFLEVNLQNVRAFKNQRVVFSFPVTAVIGTNGGGKSTILGASAIAYKGTKPGEYFPKSNVGDNSMADWRIEYKIVDRAKSSEGELTRNARFTSAKWRRDELLERNVLVFPIQRTVPADEQTKYKKYIGIYQIKPHVTSLPGVVASKAGYILGRDLTGYRIAKLSKEAREYILLGLQKDNDFSQFHFGAGEASIIEMILKIEASEPETLIAIEEIENGLHPIATERMVEYLIDAAQRKRL